MKFTCKGRKIFQEEELVGRMNCRMDITKIVLSVKQDGKNHKIKCPKCGSIAEIMRTPPDKQTDKQKV